MHVLAGLLGAVAIALVAIDVFETIVLPRRVTRRLRLTGVMYRVTWGPWRRAARLFPSGTRRKDFLSVYGPFSILLLLALWTVGLIAGFAALQWANGSALGAPGVRSGFGTDLYFSATTFLTLGLGDVVPRSGPARLLTTIEAAGGFGVLALVIGYLPTLYQAFSRREIAVSLLDARAGSPPSAGELLRRYVGAGLWDELNAYLGEWETWAAELMESLLSYPMLGYFRSQHDNQNWLAALTTILDACAFTMATLPELRGRTVHLTFAMGRHAVVDLAQVFEAPPVAPRPGRLSAEDLARLRATLAQSGLMLAEEKTMERKLSRIRSLYEPYVYALSQKLGLPLPAWVPLDHVMENWLSTAWDVRDGAVL